MSERQLLHQVDKAIRDADALVDIAIAEAKRLQLDVSYVSRRLGVPTRTVREWCVAKRIRASKPGGKWRIPSDEFARLLAAQ